MTSLHDDEFPLILEREMGGNAMGNGFGVVPKDVPPVWVGFGNYYEADAAKTQLAGHEVYRDVVYVKIAVPGDKNNIYFQPAKETDKKRFPEAWKAFQARSAGHDTSQGMPIDHWAPINKSIALTLKAAHIYTVEALAEVQDGLVDRLGIDGRGLRDRAKAFLSQARDTAATTKLAAEKKALEDQLAAMQAQIVSLTAAMQERQPAQVAPEVAAARTKRPRAQATA